MQKMYTVALPVSGVIYVEVKAEDEESAIDAALQSDQITHDRLEEWEVHRHIVRGNVCSALQWSAEVTNVREIEEGEP